MVKNLSNSPPFREIWKFLKGFLYPKKLAVSSQNFFLTVNSLRAIQITHLLPNGGKIAPGGSEIASYIKIR
jgi:hypothetical protein